MSAGLVPSPGCEGESVASCPLASGGLLATSSVPWLAVTAPLSLSSHPCGVLPVCSSVFKFPLFLRTPVLLD